MNQYGAPKKYIQGIQGLLGVLLEVSGITKGISFFDCLTFFFKKKSFQLPIYTRSLLTLLWYLESM